MRTEQTVPQTSTVQVRRGAYHDSVTLMQVSRAVSDVAGVDSALIAMATDLNLDLLRGMGFEPPDGARANDLLVAVRAADTAAMAEGLSALDAALARSTAGGRTTAGADRSPRTTGRAARRTAGSLALVSVPGEHAFTEAMDALAAGLSVLLFSDNVAVHHEIQLKDEAARRGLIVMGPDCGTAVIGGVGLGFANALSQGPVGLVAASGTGAQQVMCLLDAAGVGVSHCLGVGGRDLSAAVAGRSTRTALALLDADRATELIVVVSKPPAAGVAREITAYAEKLATPVQFALLGHGNPDLTEAAKAAVAAAGAVGAPPWQSPREWPAAQPRTGRYGTLLGLFAGGTLCDEAMLVAAASLGEIRSNIPLEQAWALEPDLRWSGHLMIDFGDDALTRGRAHPMIDQRTRLDRLALEAADPTAGVVLLDVVLGHGAHPDPAAELAPAIKAALTAAAAARHDLAVVVSLCGTAADPQGLELQAEALVGAGASVHRSNAAAARAAVQLIEATR